MRSCRVSLKEKPAKEKQLTSIQQEYLHSGSHPFCVLFSRKVVCATGGESSGIVCWEVLSPSALLIESVAYRQAGNSEGKGHFIPAPHPIPQHQQAIYVFSFV